MKHDVDRQKNLTHVVLHVPNILLELELQPSLMAFIIPEIGSCHTKAACVVAEGLV